MDEKEQDKMQKMIKEVMKELKASAKARKVDVKSDFMTQLENLEEELDEIRETIKDYKEALKAPGIKPVHTQENLRIIKNARGRRHEMLNEKKKLGLCLLMCQLDNGERRLADLSQTVKDDLRSYLEKFVCFLRHLDDQRHRDRLEQQKRADATVTNEAADVVAPEVGGPKKTYEGESSKSSHPMGRGSVYFMDNPKVVKHGDGTHLTTVAHRFDLNMEPSDDDDVIMKPNEATIE